jgi:hypothetical protein
MVKIYTIDLTVLDADTLVAVKKELTSKYMSELDYFIKYTHDHIPTKLLIYNSDIVHDNLIIKKIATQQFLMED